MKDIYKVYWEDAGAFGDTEQTWNSEKEIIELFSQANFIQITVGFKLVDNETTLIIAQSYDDTYKQYSNYIYIPKILVRDMIKLDG